MNAKNVAKNVTKGLALGILWPAAATVVVSRRVKEWVGDVSYESLAMARQWEEQIEEGVKEGVNEVSIRWEVMVHPPKPVSGGCPDTDGEVHHVIHHKQEFSLHEVSLLLAAAGIAMAFAKISIWLAVVWLTIIFLIGFTHAWRESSPSFAKA